MKMPYSVQVSTKQSRNPIFRLVKKKLVLDRAWSTLISYTFEACTARGASPGRAVTWKKNQIARSTGYSAAEEAWRGNQQFSYYTMEPDGCPKIVINSVKGCMSMKGHS